MSLNSIALGEQGNNQFLTGIKTFVARAVDELKSARFDIKAFKTETIVVGKCPDCGHEVQETQKAYTCSNRGCQFVIWKKMAGKTISSKMAANLLTFRKSGPFNGFYSKKKKQFSAFLVIKQENGRFQVAFDFNRPIAGQAVVPDSVSRPISSPGSNTKSKISADISALACPVCEGSIIEGKKGVGCSNWRPEKGNCRFVIWKEIFGKKLTIKNMEALLAGKITRSYVLKDKDAIKFKAKLRMIKEPEIFIEILPMEGNSESRFKVPCSR
ncbi:MAG: topoisomerase C-terminal repeat-containing protein [Desulfotignum sp.]|nr:topoisomerase C-terminal repeat-containing protein [Desulfobacteraceae bacterium]